MNMESTNTGGRRQRTSEEIIQLLNEFENSPGVTVKEFCEMQEISEATYYNWRKQYAVKPREEKSSGFIELINDPATAVGSPLFAEIKIVRLFQPVAAEYLKALEA